jgi:hypothetical protein
VVHEELNMAEIRDLALQAIKTGYLTLEAEEKLRYLMSHHYGQEDFLAFMRLQEAAMQGRVTQESRERLKRRHLSVAIASRT